MGGGAKPARERGFTLDPFRSRTPVRCFVAPCLMPFDANFRPLIPSLSFAHALTKVLPAQVARAARSWATSQMARRVEHAPRRGIVKRLLRYALEGHFRSLSCTSKPTEGEVPPAGCAGVVCANETNKKKTKWRAFFCCCGSRGSGGGEGQYTARCLRPASSHVLCCCGR